MEITEIEKNKIREVVSNVTICHGIGGSVREEACTIAAINLALTGKLVDNDEAECISPVLRTFIIKFQDNLPETILNSEEWKNLIPEIAGTKFFGDDKVRLNLILEYMWDVLTSVSDSFKGTTYHSAWVDMCSLKTSVAANAAYDAAYANAARVADYAAAYAADTAADTAAYANAANAAAYAADTAAYANAANAAAYAAAYAAYANAAVNKEDIIEFVTKLIAG